jgi:hypothetical protein
MNCNVYMVNYNFTTHATYPLEFMVYKYSELQMSIVIENLNCKASCKTPLFLIVFIFWKQHEDSITMFSYHSRNMTN